MKNELLTGYRKMSIVSIIWLLISLPFLFFIPESEIKIYVFLVLGWLIIGLRLSPTIVIMIDSKINKYLKQKENWTVTWKVPSAIRYGGECVTHNKVFINEIKAKDFKIFVEQSAEFIKSPIVVEIIHENK